MISRVGDLVYDIQGEGTYLTRRSRYPDLKWAPLEQFGPVQITRYTTVLSWSQGCHNYDIGAGLTVYSQEDHVQVVGPYRYFEHAREAVVISDTPTTEEEVQLELERSRVNFFAVKRIVIFPYKPGTSYLVEFKTVALRDDFWNKGGIVTDQLTLKLDRKFVYIDGGLYSQRMMSKARMFEPDPNAKIVVPGFPRGVVRRVLTYRLGGIFFAALPSMPKTHSLVFPLPTDLNYFFSEAMRNLVTWRVFTDDYRPLAEQKSLTLKHNLGDQVALLLEPFKVSSFADHGATVLQLMQNQSGAGLDHHKLRVLFKQRKDHVCWKPHEDPNMIEWIRVSNINIQVPGEPNSETTAGWSVGEILNRCRSYESGKLRVPAPFQFIRNLVSLLSANGIIVTYSLEGLDYELSYARLS